MKNQKGFTLVEGLLIVLILSVVGFAGYYVWNQSQTKETEQTKVTQELEQGKTEESVSNEEISVEEAIADNMFDKDKITTGDIVGAMTAAENTGTNNLLFEGEATVTGSYFVTDADSLLGRVWCVNEIDETSLKYIPKEINDTRDVWFCFNNEKKASSLLGDNDLGTVTVTIDDYYINLKQSSVYNTATLVDVK